MDPIDLLWLCRKGAYEGAPDDVFVPRLFSAGEFEGVWKTDRVQVRRILDELLCGPYVGAGLELLLKSGALHALFPELVAIKNLGDDPASAMHKDVWEHSKVVAASVPANVELRWGALLHDIGKSRTRKFDGRKVTFHNHDIVGAQMLDRLESRIGLFGKDDALFGTVRALILNHLRPAHYGKDWTDSGVRRLLTDIGGMRGFERLMSLSRADLTTKNANKRDRAVLRGNELEARVKAIYAEDNAPKLPKGTMGLIIERKVMPVGKGLTIVKEGLERLMAEGKLPVDKDAEWYATEGFKILMSNGPITGVGGTLVPIK